MLYHPSGLNPRGYCTQLNVCRRREAIWEDGDVLKEGQPVRWGLQDRDAQREDSGFVVHSFLVILIQFR